MGDAELGELLDAAVEAGAGLAPAIAMSSISAGSRPIAAHSARSASNAAVSSSAEALPGMNPSPRRAARRAAVLVCPPMTIGTVPLTGRGRLMQSSNET